jgi:outer membrane protein assembly factor BamB
MRPLATLFCLSVLASPLRGASADSLDNWPQWRGPLANGSAPRADPPLKWDAKTNIKWKVPLPGRGSATPVVWGDRLFVVTAVDTGRKADPKDVPAQNPRFEKKTNSPTTYHQFLVLCFDRHTGKERWRRVAAEAVPHEGHHFSHSYAAGSPVTDGKRLVVTFGSRGLYCYDLGGKLLWKRDFGRMETRLGWGEGATPALHGDTVIVNWDHEGPDFIAALEADTGRTRWKVDRDEPTSWATPLVVEHKGRTQVVVVATNKIRSYDLATGKEVWQCGGMTINCIPSPVVYGDHVICMSGYKGSLALSISLDSAGDVTGSEGVRWKHDRGTPYVPSPVLAGDRLYFTMLNDPRLSCLDARTGKVLFDRVRLTGVRSFYGSPVAAAGRIYLTDRDGTTLVIKQSDKLEVLATNRLDDPVDASPVAVGKHLYLRGEKYLYCIGE